MARLFSYSISIDFHLQDGVLNLYVPVLPSTKELVQQLMDLKNPLREHYDDSQSLIAMEWGFKGKMVDKVLRNKKWQKLFE